MPAPSLPPELLDHIIDLLHDSQTALRNCCLVSKSWIPRTRAHLFAEVEFVTKEELESWKEKFPDPSASPARYTKTLTVRCEIVTAKDAEEGGWIRGFSYVERLEVTADGDFGEMVSFLPFRGFSPILKSLRLDPHFHPLSQLFDLILSFPLLEDLNVAKLTDYNNNDVGSPRTSTVVQPPNQPMTGFLDLSRWYPWLGFIANWLLSLPGGIHFCKLAVQCSKPQDILVATKLVEECSHTLEYIEIDYDYDGTPIWYPLPHRQLIFGSASWESDSLDLSKANRLKHSVFRVESDLVDWVTMALRTIKPEHRDFRQITIDLPSISSLFRPIVGEVIFGQWLELDRLLAQLWESHSIRPKVLCYAPVGTENRVTERVGSLLPEVTGRGIIDWDFELRAVLEYIETE